MCNASKTGSSDRRAARSSPASGDNRGSAAGEVSSWLELGEPERSQRRPRLQVGERHLERRRAGDQDHVISYSHLVQGRISTQQPGACDFAQAAPRTVPGYRPLDRPADCDADARLDRLARHGETAQGSPAVNPPATDRRLEVRAPAQPQSSLHTERAPRDPCHRRREWRLRGQPLSAFSAAIAKHPCPTPSAHPAQEAMDTPAIAFLGLICPFDRASVAEPTNHPCDTGSITSSHDQCALRYPQASAIVRGRKQPSIASNQRPSTDCTCWSHQYL